MKEYTQTYFYIKHRQQNKKKLEENRKTWFDFFSSFAFCCDLWTWMKKKEWDVYIQRFEKEEFERLKEIEKS